MYGVGIPPAFWKFIAFIHDETGKLCATGYEMYQETTLQPEKEFVFGRLHRRSSRSLPRSRSGRSRRAAASASAAQIRQLLATRGSVMESRERHWKLWTRFGLFVEGARSRHNRSQRYALPDPRSSTWTGRGIISIFPEAWSSKSPTSRLLARPSSFHL
jgi:hypothetical protein